MTEISVTGLCVYPVKSCAGIGLDVAQVTPRGLAHDRDFMIVGDDNSFISQRKVAEMALVVPAIGEDSITLKAPGMSPLELPLERPDGEAVVASVHGNAVIGQAMGQEFDDWFTEFLPRYKENERYRLLRVREDSPRRVSDRYRKRGAANHLGFADGHPILLASESSLASLNAEMEEAVPMNRFRPNVVVAGANLKPYAEDRWVEIEVGEMTAYVVKGCDRCVIPDVDQATAVTGKAVRRALFTRRGVNAHDDTNKGVFFAQNLNHVYVPGLTLQVGDVVRIVERAAKPNVVLRTS